MKSDWEEVELIKICNEIVDCINKTAPIVNYKTSYKMIRTTNVKKGIVDTENVRYVTKGIYEKWIRRSIPQYGDVILTREAPLGEVGMITVHNEKIFLGQRLMSYRTNSEKLNNHFLLYSLQGIYMQWQIKSFASGSTVQHIRVGDAEKIKIKLPPLSTQKKIAHILSTLDDKIELNRKMNQTLEEMAQALFKSWFVDFDPVHARANNKESDDVVARELGISVEVLKLFPSVFVESELGLIPEGWEVSTIGKEFNVTMGQSPSGKSYNEVRDGMIFFQGRRDFGEYYPSERVYTTEPKRVAEENDILLSVRAPVGDINIAIEKCCIGRGLASLKHKSNSVSYGYIALKNLHKYFKSYNSEGTVFGSINQKNLKSLVIVRNDNIMKKFDEIAEQLFQQIKLNSQEMQTLQKIRDALLPKLLSGELDLSKIEEKK